MRRAHILVPALVIMMTSCDGHVRSFNAFPDMGGRSTTVHADPKWLEAVIAEVATDGGFIREEAKVESDFYTVKAVYHKQIGSNTVVLKLIKNNTQGTYHFVIIDWPQFVRSEESRALEMAIRGKLQVRPPRS